MTICDDLFSSAGAKNQFGVLIDAARIAPVAVTNALDHQADIAKVQEWFGL